MRMQSLGGAVGGSAWGLASKCRGHKRGVATNTSTQGDGNKRSRGEGVRIAGRENMMQQPEGGLCWGVQAGGGQLVGAAAAAHSPRQAVGTKLPQRIQRRGPPAAAAAAAAVRTTGVC